MSTFKVALISDVFYGTGSEERLDERLQEVRATGAELAVLPEIPLDPWLPATKDVRHEDAEEPGGPRHQRLAGAARRNGLALLGGAIVREASDGARYNTALVMSAGGELVATARKLHLPEEPGFWETSHYRAGDRAPRVVAGFPMPFGVQICSDINRPVGAELLAARGAEIILVPRATEASTFERWRLVLRAAAVTSSCYVLSVNRPGPEGGVPLGGSSIVIDPDGRVLTETEDTLCVAELTSEVVRDARARYPGYVARPASIYAEAWQSL